MTEETREEFFIASMRTEDGQTHWVAREFTEFYLSTRKDFAFHFRHKQEPFHIADGWHQKEWQWKADPTTITVYRCVERRTVNREIEEEVFRLPREPLEATMTTMNQRISQCQARDY